MKNKNGIPPYQKQKFWCGGITLIELVLSIIIIAVCFGVVSTIYMQVLGKIHRSRVIVIANALAEERMDRVLGEGFSGIEDDISATAQWQVIYSGSFTGVFSDYDYEDVACYVNSGDLDTPVAVETEYIAVRTRIDHTDIGSLTVRSLLTDYAD